MNNTNNKTKITNNATEVNTTTTTSEKVVNKFTPRGRRRDVSNGPRRNTRRSIMQKDIILQKRVSKTRKGGRQKSRAIFVAMGNAKEHTVTYGKSKHSIKQRRSMMDLIDSAARNGSKKLFKVATYKDTVAHNMIHKSNGIKIVIMQSFSGYIEGNEVVRKICNLSGIKSIKVKMIGNTNSKYNQTYAFCNALRRIENVEQVAHRTGKTIGEILSRKLQFINRRTA